MKNRCYFILLLILLLLVLYSCEANTNSSSTADDNTNYVNSSDEESFVEDESAEVSSAEEDPYFNYNELKDGTLELSAKLDAKLPEDVIIPTEHDGKKVTKIATDAFMNITDVKTITISEGITQVGRYAFNGCTSLCKVVFPQSIKNLNFRIFVGCDSLSVIEIPFVGTSRDAQISEGFLGQIFGTSFASEDELYTFVPRSLKEVVINEGCERIPYAAFGGMVSLEHVVLPKSIKIIESCDNRSSFQ